MPWWIGSDFERAELGDPRRTRRLVALGEAFCAHPTASIPQACVAWSQTKAAYRFLNDDFVSTEAIREAHANATVERASTCETVLVIQDTTCLDFTTREATTGLGPLPHPALSGLLLHSALAADDTGVPLGLLHQKTWARDRETIGKGRQRKQKTTSQKESQRWLDAEQETLARLNADVRVVTIGDREADIYDLLRQDRREGAYLLVRAAQDRRVTGENHRLFQRVRAAEVVGRRVLSLNRHDERPAREARLTLRYCRVAIEPPTGRIDRASLGLVEAVAILVEEEDTPEGETSVRWLLLTTLPVSTVEEAWRCVKWYSYRWLIERYHFVLKSGCRIEELQLKEARRIEIALSIYAVVAWRLAWLTYMARRQPEVSCEIAFEEHQWRILFAMVRKTMPPPDPPSLREMTRDLARLGGFLGRRHDGEPGLKVMWRGWHRLNEIIETYRTLRPFNNNPAGLVGNA